MKKINIILICIIIALISGIIGFTIGMNVKGNCTSSSVTQQNDENNIVGTYKTNTWNGKEAVLVLNKDKTMIHPTGSKGIWLLEDGKLYVEYEMEIPIWDNNGTEQNKTSTNKQEVTIVDGGLMLNTHFFEKVK